LSICDKYFVVKDQGFRTKTQFEKGIGLVDFSVSVHYASPIAYFSGKNFEEEHRKASLKRDIYAIKENSCLVYDEKISSIGEVYRFSKGKKTRI